MNFYIRAKALVDCLETLHSLHHQARERGGTAFSPVERLHADLLQQRQEVYEAATRALEGLFKYQAS